ncbi:hypothetical protein [Spirillospora sp. NPDC029432]|uniref:hypothetical protein n=1 Tax=Spirillospora sp. NPDC029432 TaxID=3154599 RepID=UPI00345494F5
MEITRKKGTALGIAGLAVLGVVAAAIVYVLLTDSKELRYPTQSALRGALGTTAADELRGRGIQLQKALSCHDLPGWTKLKLRAGCSGSTADKKTVQVIATGEDETREHHYTILVDGRPVVENARCLGADCGKKAE